MIYLIRNLKFLDAISIFLNFILTLQPNSVLTVSMDRSLYVLRLLKEFSINMIRLIFKLKLNLIRTRDMR